MDTHAQLVERPLLQSYSQAMASFFSLWAPVKRGNWFNILFVKRIVLNNSLNTRCNNAFGWMPHNITDGKLTLTQVIIWCCEVYVASFYELSKNQICYCDILFRGIELISYSFPYIYMCVCVMAYITEPLASLDIRLDATFKQEYSDATHATTLALSTSMKAQVSNLPMSLDSFWEIQFLM